METIVNNMDKFVIDENSAMKIYRSIRWGNGLVCPHCGSDNVYNRGSQDDNTRKYSCNSCKKNFNDFTNTIFAYSKIPLGKLLYILVNVKFKSVLQLSKELDLHRNTVGRYHKRIREFLLENNEIPSFDGNVEMNEAYIIAGAKGIKKNSKIDGLPRKRALKKVGRGTYDTDKPPVTTFVHRESIFTIFSVKKNLSKKRVSYLMDEYIKDEATLYTDEYSIYQDIDNHPKIKEHHTINHSQKEYARGKVYVNNCENRYSLLRPFIRIFRSISKRLLAGYVMLFQYLFNYKEDAPDKILQTMFKVATS